LFRGSSSACPRGEKCARRTPVGTISRRCQGPFTTIKSDAIARVLRAKNTAARSLAPGRRVHPSGRTSSPHIERLQHRGDVTPLELRRVPYVAATAPPFALIALFDENQARLLITAGSIASHGRQRPFYNGFDVPIATDFCRSFGGSTRSCCRRLSRNLRANS